MPLARIITDSVDDSLELTIQLRARGFQVETVAPGTIPNTPADLEVRLEECASEDALSQASKTLTHDDLWVFVAPGALDERVRVIREIPIELMPGLESKVVPPSWPIPSVAPLLPFLTPEDDPILAELVELKRASEGHEQPAAPECSPEKAEIVVFPTVGEPLVAAESRVSWAEPETVRGGAAESRANVCGEPSILEDCDDRSGLSDHCTAGGGQYEPAAQPPASRIARRHDERAASDSPIAGACDRDAA